MIQFFLNAHNYGDFVFLLLRLAIGAIFLAHGLPKREMWKAAPSENMTKSMIYILRGLSVYEPLAAVAIITGFLTQFFAAGLIVVMIGAIYMKVFVWGKKFSSDGGWEFEFILLASLIVVLCFGAGAYGLDRPLLGL